MRHRLRFIGAKGLHSDSQLSYLFFHHFGLDKGSTLDRKKQIIERLGEFFECQIYLDYYKP